MNVGHIVVKAIKRYSESVAFESPDDIVTFREMGDRIDRLGRGLALLGLKPGDRVLDLQRNSTMYAVTDLGLATAGLCRVALNYRQTPADWLRVAQDCNPKALIYSSDFADQIEELREAVELSLCVDGGGDDRDLGHVMDHDMGRGMPTPSRSTPDSLVSLNYSSGTSGAPKGSRRTHRSRLASLGNMVSDVFLERPGADETWLHVAPMTHASGLFVLPCFVFGVRQVVMPGFSADSFASVVNEHQVTGTVLVPTMVARLLEEGVASDDLRSLRRLVYAGAPMGEEQIRAAYDRLTPKLVQMYGMVEAVPPVSILGVDEHREAIERGEDWLTSAGTICTTVAVEVRDEDDQVVPDGELGEILVSGDNVMDGYWGPQDTSDMKHVTEGWLRTGDIGRVEDGRLFLAGRKGDMIITGGYNVYPLEVEAQILRVEGVDDVVVFGTPDPEWGQVVTAAFTGRPSAEQDIRTHCSEHLAGYKKPRLLHWMSQFPVNHNGKVARKDVVAALLGTGEQSAG